MEYIAGAVISLGVGAFSKYYCVRQYQRNVRDIRDAEVRATCHPVYSPTYCSTKIQLRGTDPQIYTDSNGVGHNLMAVKKTTPKQLEKVYGPLHFQHYASLFMYLHDQDRDLLNELDASFHKYLPYKKICNYTDSTGSNSVLYGVYDNTRMTVIGDCRDDGGDKVIMSPSADRFSIISEKTHDEILKDELYKYYGWWCISNTMTGLGTLFLGFGLKTLCNRFNKEK